jgi:hypothetical protein
MSKSNKAPRKRRTDGLPEDTERVTYRWLEGPDDPAYALLMGTFSMRNVPMKKKPADEEV